MYESRHEFGIVGSAIGHPISDAIVQLVFDQAKTLSEEVVARPAYHVSDSTRHIRATLDASIADTGAGLQLQLQR